MPLTNAGRNFIVQAITGSGGLVFFNNENSYIGIGNSDATFSPEQTDLQGLSIRKKVDPGYPIINGNEIILKATFGEDEANFAWQEWGVFNAASGGVMFCRNIEDMGKKNSGVWSLNLVISLE